MIPWPPAVAPDPPTTVHAVTGEVPAGPVFPGVPCGPCWLQTIGLCPREQRFWRNSACVCLSTQPWIVLAPTRRDRITRARREKDGDVADDVRADVPKDSMVHDGPTSHEHFGLQLFPIALPRPAGPAVCEAC